ncbi:riboflavin kinase/FMN adenylyltransferase [Catenibacillus scindens]|uniref:Riboflavin biosynthesis protein n=1 Tax=Catenibacillus scindens TaxID=673271 RepID=A0A7W8M3I6_9FIRM|nr:riboflavin biosynthesis protein RibF [Catenibacillus scindens]MBB5263095.1 riboflavin kinase/FMN adenylyltransferase [Catenibacillus scindens]
MIFISGTKEIWLENTAVAIGKFDGLHRGHQSLIQKINSYKSHHMTSVVLTFNYNPACRLKGQNPVLIYTSLERRIIASRLGVDVLIEYPFTDETAHMEAKDFIQEVLIGRLGARHIVVGEDFHFGRERRGDGALLTGMSLPLGYSAHICPKIHTELPKSFLSDDPAIPADVKDEADISATLIRKAISRGEIEIANDMLGIPYTIIGEVVHGREIGRTIGMPTANLEPGPTKLLPPNGVYASAAVIDRRVYPAVTNVGRNPTVAQNQNRRVETYIHGFSGNIYGRQIEVRLYHFARPERKFENLDALKAQMHRDMENSLAYMEKNLRDGQ